MCFQPSLKGTFYDTMTTNIPLSIWHTYHRGHMWYINSLYTEAVPHSLNHKNRINRKTMPFKKKLFPKIIYATNNSTESPVRRPHSMELSEWLDNIYGFCGVLPQTRVIRRVLFRWKIKLISVNTINEIFFRPSFLTL